MACKQETQILISRYANGESTHEEMANATAHLEGCAECRNLFEQWREQRQLFVWANTLNLPDLTAKALVERACESQPSVAAASVRRRRTWAIPGGTRSRGFALAALCLIAALGIWRFRVLNSVPHLASGATVFKVAQTVGVYDGATLEVAPKTRLTRLGANRIRLDSGWIRARVRHGGGLHISTSRLDVRDIGTVFQMSAGPAEDNVFVEQGEVSATGGGKSYTVDADQILLASADGKVEIARFPKHFPAEDEPGSPLFNDSQAFTTPQGDDGLDWDEGLRRLGTRFPDLRTCGASGGGVSWADQNGNKAVRFYRTLAQGARKGLRAHITDIAGAQARSITSKGEWSFPIAYVMADDISDPAGLPPDTYRVDMLAEDSKLLWWFRGSRGGEAKAPVRFESASVIKTGSSGSFTTSSGTMRESLSEKTPGEYAAAIQFPDWPGKYKPTLSLKLRPAPYHSSRRAMLDEAIRRTAGVQGLILRENEATALNLNAQRSVRVLIAHNRNAGRQLGSLLRDGKPYRAGSALMGVVMTESAWAQPHLPAGAYLLWWTVSRPGATPRWAVSRPGTSRLVYLTPDKVTISKDEGQSSFQWQLWLQPDREGKSNPDIDVNTKAYSARAEGFPFEFEASSISSSGNSYSAGAGMGKGRFVIRNQ